MTQTRRLPADLEEPGSWETEEEDSWAALLEQEGYTTVWEYGAFGQVLSRKDARGNLQKTAYGMAGEMKGISLTLKGKEEKSIVSKAEYNASGQRLYITHGNGAETEYTYEEATQRLTGLKTMRPTSSGGREVLQDLYYEYDLVGNVVLTGDRTEGEQYHRNQRVVPERRFTYDALYRLVSSAGRESDARRTYPSFPPVIAPMPLDESRYVNYRESYEYDKGGNLTCVRHQGANSYVNEMAISERSNRGVWLEDQESVEVEDRFDRAGNLLELMRGIPLEWDSRNRLKRASQVVREGDEDDRESYLYDAGGMRIVKRTVRKALGTTNSSTVVYLPGLEIRIKQTGEHLEVTEAGEGVRILHWEEDTKPEGIPNDQYRYGSTDLTGSVMLELDGEGQVISREEYYAYGGTAVWTARSEIEAGYKTVRYSGKELDATGLYYYGYRYYMPWACRWLNADPIGTADGLNLYRMAGNSPVTKSDPNGLMERESNPGSSRGLKGAFKSIFRRKGSSSTSHQAPKADPPSVSHRVPSAGSSSEMPHSYVFFDPTNLLISKESELIYQKLKDMKKSHVHLISINSNEDFIEEWNEMGMGGKRPVPVKTVVINTHGSSEAIKFFDGTNKWEFGSSDILQLENKKIGELILLSCNAGNLAYKDTNPAAQFARKVNGAPVLASDGTVHSTKTDSNQDHGIQESEGEGWYVYGYNNGVIKISGDGTTIFMGGIESMIEYFQEGLPEIARVNIHN